MYSFVRKIMCLWGHWIENKIYNGWWTLKLQCNLPAERCFCLISWLGTYSWPLTKSLRGYFQNIFSVLMALCAVHCVLLPNLCYILSLVRWKWGPFENDVPQGCLVVWVVTYVGCHFGRQNLVKTLMRCVYEVGSPNKWHWQKFPVGKCSETLKRMDKI